MLGALSFADSLHSDWVWEVVSVCGLNVRSQNGCTILTALDHPPPCSGLDNISPLAADVVLTHRDELASALGLTDIDLRDVSDLDLVILAYRKWGESCAEHLEGDYAFALWDDRGRHVFCCVDHLGAIPLIYWRDRDRLVVGSTNATVLAVPGVPRRLNRRKLEGLCVRGGQHFRDEETFHEGILSLRSGTCLTIDCSTVRRRTYWEPAIEPSIIPKSPRDAFAELRSLLFDAIGSRITRSNSVGVLLSGGLDSSAIAAIAARTLQNQNRCVTGIAAVVPPENVERFGDEREYVEEFRVFPNIRIEYSDASGRGPFDNIENPAHFEDGLMRTSRDFLYDAIGEIAASCGIDILLAGGGGEMSATCYGTGYYLELLSRLRLGTLFGELRAAAGVLGTSRFRVLARDVVRLMEIGPDFVPVAFFTPEFMWDSDTPSLRFSHSPNHQTRQIEMVRHYLRKHALRAETLLGTIPMRAPLADKRVIEFCLAAGGELKVRDGYNRYLIRGALDGLLPEKIQWRTSKMPWSPDYAARYDAQLGKARDFVSAIGRRDPVRSIVDVDRLASALIPAETPGHLWTALVRVPATINLICFLRQFSEFQS